MKLDNKPNQYFFEAPLNDEQLEQRAARAEVLRNLEFGFEPRIPMQSFEKQEMTPEELHEFLLKWQPGSEFRQEDESGLKPFVKHVILKLESDYLNLCIVNVGKPEYFMSHVAPVFVAWSQFLTKNTIPENITITLTAEEPGLGVLNVIDLRRTIQKLMQSKGEWEKEIKYMGGRPTMASAMLFGENATWVPYAKALAGFFHVRTDNNVNDLQLGINNVHTHAGDTVKNREMLGLSY